MLSCNLNSFALSESGKEKLLRAWNATEEYRRIDGQWRIVHSNWSLASHSKPHPRLEMVNKMPNFDGFSTEAFAFLKDVQQHNSKEWFDSHRNDYEEHLLTPFRSLVEAVGMAMQQIDELIEIRPAVGKTISHLRRDTRFSHDKSLYRNNMWFTFKRPKKNWLDSPTYFFEFTPDWWHYGLGYYSASPATLGVFREHLVEFPHEFQQALEAIPEGFVVHAESYKRQVAPQTLPPNLASWYKSKSFYVAKKSEDMTPLLSHTLPDALLEGFQELSGLYDFLIDVEHRKQGRKQGD